MSSPDLNDLTPRKRKYVKGIVEGKTKKQAALDAGYAESTAEKAKTHIETPDVRIAFAVLIREAVPAELLAKKIQEGLEAIETKFFQKDGEVVDSRDVIAWSERRQYAELAAEYGGYFTPHAEIDVSGKNGGPIEHCIRFISKNEKPDA